MHMHMLGLLLLQTVVHTSTPAPVEHAAHAQHSVYFADRNAQADVDNALVNAKISGKTIIVIMGADWCHDSVSLAARLDTPRFATMMRDRYAIVYIDAGTPQTGKGRNLDIAKRFGITKVKTTPLVMMVSSDGQLLNSKKDAASWRNAANRSEQAIFDYFNGFTRA